MVRDPHIFFYGLLCPVLWIGDWLCQVPSKRPWPAGTAADCHSWRADGGGLHRRAVEPLFWCCKTCAVDLNFIPTHQGLGI